MKVNDLLEFITCEVSIYKRSTSSEVKICYVDLYNGTPALVPQEIRDKEIHLISSSKPRVLNIQVIA